MKKYQIIYADPPWNQRRGGKKAVRPVSSGECLPYPVMEMSSIQDVLATASQLGDTDHCFFVWAIDKTLHDAESMMLGLGYRLHARMIWNKVTGIPAAFTIRFGHEYLLWFYKDHLLPVAVSERGKIHSVFTEQVTEHSRKPEIAYSILERLYPDTQRLELFARKPRDGWDVCGNGVNNHEDIRISLARMIAENDD